MAMRFNPKDLGLNAKFFYCPWTVHELDFWVVLDSPKIKILRPFSDNPELDYETDSFKLSMHEIWCVLLK